MLRFLSSIKRNYQFRQIQAEKKRNDIQPPWAVSESRNPGDDPHWLTGEGKKWLCNVFLPFYDALPHPDQIEYCERWNAPQSWISLFLHPDMDEIAAEADREHLGTFAAPPLNYRKIFLGDPNT